MEKRAGGEYAQGRIMADESMVRTLHYQAACIWPREQQLFEALGLDRHREVVDLGCGTGEISSRLARNYPHMRVLGVDLEATNINVAQSRYQDLTNLSFIQGDATRTPFSDGQFDLAINRHMLQAIPQPEAVITEMGRIVKPGGVLYFLAEDYAMIHGAGIRVEEIFIRIGDEMLNQGTDLLIGRKIPSLLGELGFKAVDIHYLAIDTQTADRNDLAGVFRNWAEGYTDFLAEHTYLSHEQAAGLFQQLIACSLDPKRYLVWLIPIIVAKNPG